MWYCTSPHPPCSCWMMMWLVPLPVCSCPCFHASPKCTHRYTHEREVHTYISFLKLKPMLKPKITNNLIWHLVIHCPKSRLFFILKFRAESYDCSIRNVEGGVFFAESGSIQVNLKSEFKKFQSKLGGQICESRAEQRSVEKGWCARLKKMVITIVAQFDRLLGNSPIME